MSELTGRVRAALWWLVPLALAVAALAWETDFGRAIRRPRAPEEPVAARPVVTSLLPEYAIAGGPAARTDTVQRTLFNPTRRPAPPAVAEAAKPRIQRGQFMLTGTMVVGGKNTAFLRETAAGGKSRRVQQGETINGMLVADVKPDRVRLALGDESEEIVMRVATNPRPTTPPAAPGAAPAGAMPPVAAPAPAAAPSPAVAGAAAPTGAEASLAERRRAARAAQAALQAQTSTPDGNPIPAPPPAAATTTAPPPGSAPDPRWQDVYRRYQERPTSPIAK